MSSFFRYESHFALPLGRKKGAKLTDAEEANLNKKRSKKAAKKYTERQKDAKVEQGLTDQFMTGELIYIFQCKIDLHIKYFSQVVFWPPSPPGPASAAGPTATCWRARSWSST